MILNRGQEKVITDGVNFIRHGNKQVYDFCGPAGTGKSVCLFEIARRSGYDLHQIAAMAYIGQAAIIMRYKGFPTAKTIHSTIKECKIVPLIENGIEVLDPLLGTPITILQFVKREIGDEIRLFIIDESYTTPMSLRESILEYGRPVIAGGDRRQLPPVADDPAFCYRPDCPELTEIVRQQENSGIIYIATQLSLGKTVYPGVYGTDCIVIYEDELNDETLSEADLIVCGTNKTRDKYNNHIRHNILNIDSDLPQPGEKVICRTNDWSYAVDGISLANGLRGTVIEPVDLSTFHDDHFQISFLPDLFDTPFRGIDINYNYLNGDKQMKEAVRRDRYSTGYNFEYAYCLTSYLSQGSQARNVVAIQDYLSKELNPHSWYTSATRATDKLIYVIPKPKKYYQINY